MIAGFLNKLSLICILEGIRNGKIRQHLLGYHHKCTLIWKINPLDHAISCLFFQNLVQAILHKRQETLGASDKLMFAYLMLLWPSFELHWNPTNGLFWDNFPCNIFGFHVCYISLQVRRLNKCQWSPQVCVNFLDYMGASVSEGNIFPREKRVPQKWLENKNILNLAAIATCHFSVIFLLPKFWVSHFCMPMSSRCMSPYWLFENHPEIGLSLSINLSHMKAIKNTKTKKEIKSSNPNHLFGFKYSNNTTHHQQTNKPTNHGWVNGLSTKPHNTNKTQPAPTWPLSRATASWKICGLSLYLSIYLHVCKHVYIHTYIFLCIYIFVYVYLYIYIYMFV